MNSQVSKYFGGSVCAIVVVVILMTVAAVVPAHAATPSKASPAAAPDAATTTFNFSDIPVRSALQLFAEQGHFNLVVSDSVQGKISLHLVDVTWEEALDVVLRLKGLEQRVDGNTRWVDSTRGR